MGIFWVNGTLSVSEVRGEKSGFKAFATQAKNVPSKQLDSAKPFNSRSESFPYEQLDILKVRQSILFIFKILRLSSIQIIIQTNFSHTFS